MPVTERPILLTGATGFVGMAVLARLLAAGHEVHCLVRAADDAEADSRLRAVLRARAGPRDAAAPSPSPATSPRRAWGSATATTSSPRGVGHRHPQRRLGRLRPSDRGGARHQRRGHAAGARLRGRRSRPAARGLRVDRLRRRRPPRHRLRGRPRDRHVPQLLRALQARGGGARALEHAAVDDRAAEHRRGREHHRAGRRPSTSSTGRCGPSTPAPTRCCPRAGARRSTWCRSTTSPTRSPRSRATPRRRAGPST